ncbi:MAG: hypothetical protein HY926_08305 [Elusimicrobia bacterium]|nr:hypothetical protein [Elusimicrobiota bacterium]
MNNHRIHLSLLLCLLLCPAAPVFAAPAAKDKGEVVFPPPPDKPRLRLLRSIRSAMDLKGQKPGLLRKFLSALSGDDAESSVVVRPYGIWVRGDLIYLTDTEGQKVVVLDQKTAKVRTVEGTGSASLGSPVGVTADDAGNLYVSDTGDHTVKAFGPDGKLLWTSPGPGGADGMFKRPSGLGWTLAGELMVLDSGNGRIVALSKEGKSLRVFCKNMKDPFALPNPGNLWVEKDGAFLVSDPLLGRVHIFAADGKYISGFGELGDSAGYMARPRGVASDSDGNIYVADAMFNRVQLFNRKGQVLMYFGGPGQEPGQLALPAGIFIDASDKVYVVDSKNRRVQVFQYIKYPEEKTGSTEPAKEETPAKPSK